MMRLLLLSIATSGLLFLPSGSAAETGGELPVITGTISFTEGSFFGFAHPAVGDSLTLDLAHLDSIRDALPFKGKDASHVVLAAPLRIEKLNRLPDGSLNSARLVSAADDRRWRVTMDIQRHGAFTPPRARVWIIGESDGLVQSVARLECELSK